MKPRPGWGGAGVANANLGVKEQLRREVMLELATPARVFECYAGDGELTQVWCKLGAESVTGVDAKSWELGAEPRIVSDVTRCLRTVDLHQFNVFDVDAWGSPLYAMIALGDIRGFAAGERCAVVWTDGALTNTMRGRRGSALQLLLTGNGHARIHEPTGHNIAKKLHNAALMAWFRRAKVTATRTWQTDFKRPGSGYIMRYGAAIIEGQPTSDS